MTSETLVWSNRRLLTVEWPSVFVPLILCIDGRICHETNSSIPHTHPGICIIPCLVRGVPSTHNIASVHNEQFST